MAPGTITISTKFEPMTAPPGGRTRMNELGSLLSYLRDPKLAAHATSALPAWLWSVDATRVLWANPTAAAVFDVASPAALPATPSIQKAVRPCRSRAWPGRLPQGAAPRLERLRGFGARLGRAADVRLLADQSGRPHTRHPGAGDRTGRRGLPLAERVRRLSIGIEAPIAFFSGGGELMHATPAGEARTARPEIDRRRSAPTSSPAKRWWPVAPQVHHISDRSRSTASAPTRRSCCW